MPKNEDGEFELLVGNKQLLSIVFIVMVLFGVIFSMGYFVGRNSAPEPTSAGAVRPAASDSSFGARPHAAAPPSAFEAPPASGTESASLRPGQAELTGTMAVQPQANEAASAQAGTPPQTRPEGQSTASPRPIPVPRASAISSTGPAPGETFLQVAAVNRSEADLVAEVLRKKSFSALVAPGPNPTLFRVLVGPVRDAATLGRTRAGLEAAGFKSIVRKY